MKYKDGLHFVRENTVCGGVFAYGGPQAQVGVHGGDVGNSDWYAPGDARNLWGMGPAKKGKKSKKDKKNKKFPLYRRKFVETLTTESADEDYILNCLIYTEVYDYQKVILDILEKYDIPHSTDVNCVLIEGTDDYLQTVLEKMQSIISIDPFEDGGVVVLMGEMDTVSKNQIQGGKADNKTYEEFFKRYSDRFSGRDDFKNQFNDKIKQGVKIEMEHTTSKDIAIEIASDHLWEDIDYYDKLAKIENK